MERLNTRWGYCSASLAVLALLFLSHCWADTVVSDDWQVLYIVGVKAGYIHSEVVLETTGAKPVYLTRSQTELCVLRGKTSAAARIITEVREDSDGRILSFRSKLGTSREPVISEGKRVGARMLITQSSFGRSRRYEVTIPADVVGPYACTRLMLKRGFAPGTRYSFRLFEPEACKVVKTTVEVVGPDVVSVQGKVRMLHKMRISQDLLPLLSAYQWCDDTGQVIKSEVKRLGMVTVKATREEALRVASGPKVDLLLSLSAPCNILIPHPYLTSQAEYLLVSSATGSAIKIPEDERQQLERSSAGIVVRIRAGEFKPQDALNRPLHDSKLDEYLRPGTYVQSDDPQISEVARRVIGATANSYFAAKRLCQWVHKNISRKNYSIGFASAKEVLQRLEGDCTEHSVLLAALLRAVGIPSRAVAGLVYADGAFGYHMWNEAFVGKWIPLDATLGRGGNDWDAVHIKLAQSSLSSASPLADLAAVASSIGRTRVEVVSFTADGQKVKTRTPGPMSRIRGDRYENFLYGFTFKKPGPARFSEPANLLRSSWAVRVRSGERQGAMLSVSARPIGFGYGISEILGLVAGQGREPIGVFRFRISGRPAARCVLKGVGEDVRALLVYDRDVLIELRTSGSGQQAALLFEYAVKSFKFLR